MRVASNRDYVHVLSSVTVELLEQALQINVLIRRNSFVLSMLLHELEKIGDVVLRDALHRVDVLHHRLVDGRCFIEPSQCFRCLTKLVVKLSL